MKTKKVKDLEQGEFLFPADDKVMLPFIEEHGVWELNEVNWLKKFVVPGMTCLNVGANIGYFTVLMSNLVGKSGKVFCIEPNPQLYDILSENIKNLALDNVVIYRFAATDFDGEIELYLNKVNYGDSRVFDPRITNGGGTYLDAGFTENLKSIRVEANKIDTIFSGIKIDVVLIDAQGADHLVLRGARQTIENSMPEMLIEFVPEWIQDMGDVPRKVLAEFKSLGRGYKIKTPDLKLKNDDVLASLKSSNNFFTNLHLKPVGFIESYLLSIINRMQNLF
jgi:FkbM family methyltransferase